MFKLVASKLAFLANFQQTGSEDGDRTALLALKSFNITRIHSGNALTHG